MGACILQEPKFESFLGMDGPGICILQYLCWAFYTVEYPFYKCIFFHDIWYNHSIGYNLVFHSTVNVGDFGYHCNLSNHFIGLICCFELCIHFIGMWQFTFKYPFFSTTKVCKNFHMRKIMKPLNYSQVILCNAEIVLVICGHRSDVVLQHKTTSLL